MLAKSEMITLLMMGLCGDNQVSHALAVTKLSEHQCKKLIPTCEMLHIAVTTVFVNDVTKLVKVQELYQLREYVF